MTESKRERSIIDLIVQVSTSAFPVGTPLNDKSKNIECGWFNLAVLRGIEFYRFSFNRNQTCKERYNFHSSLLVLLNTMLRFRMCRRGAVLAINPLIVMVNAVLAE